MKVYFVRHGLTDSNVSKRVMGVRIDEPLNERGLKEAEELAHTIKDKGSFEILLSSPLKRAYQTAEALARTLKFPVVAVQELVERDFGSLSGKTWAEIKEETKGVLTVERLHRELELDFSPWGGETKEAVRERLGRFVEHLRGTHAGKGIIVVTHAGVLRVLRCMYHRPLTERIPNLTVIPFEV